MKEVKERKLLFRLLRYYRKYIKDSIIIAVGTLIGSCVSLLFPVVSKYVLGKMPNYSWPGCLKQLGVVLIIYLIIAGMQVLYDRVRYYNTSIMYAKLMEDLRTDLMKKLHKLSFRWHADHHSGNIVTLMDGDCDGASHMISDILPEILGIVLEFIGGIILFFTISPELTLVTMIPLAAMGAFTIKIAPKMRAKIKRVRDIVSEHNAFVKDCIDGIETVVGFNMEGYMMDKHASICGRITKAIGDKWHIVFVQSASVRFMRSIVFDTLIIVGAILVSLGRMSAMDVAIFYMYFYLIANPIMFLDNHVKEWAKCMASYERIIEVLDAEEEIQNPTDENHVWTYGMKLGDVCLSDVTFNYGGDNILNHLSLHVPKGDFVAIVGESGNGKSTIAKLIPRYYDVCDGSVKINGIDVRDISLGTLRSNVGVCNQDPYIYDGTILDNLRCVKPSCTLDEICEVIKKANLHDFIESLPKGLDTVVGERGIKLSGGQKQRIAIARLFLLNPPIMIFDEATSSLDNISEKEIQNTLEKMQEDGKTVIVIAHRLSTIINADKIYVLGKDGTIVEKGTHNTLLKKNGEYARLYNISQ